MAAVQRFDFGMAVLFSVDLEHAADGCRSIVPRCRFNIASDEVVRNCDAFRSFRGEGVSRLTKRAACFLTTRECIMYHSDGNLMLVPSAAAV